MFNFAKSYMVESKALPGVVATLRRIGPRERAEIELSVSAARIRQREIATRREQLSQQITALLDGVRDADGKVAEAAIPEASIGLALEYHALGDEGALLARSIIEPAFVVAAVKSISEITYEDQPATGELLCIHGPDALFDEIAEAIGKHSYLTAEDAETFKLPTTSGAQGAGQAKSTTAAAASESAAGVSADAASTSLAT